MPAAASASQTATPVALSLSVRRYSECVDALMAFRNRNRPITRDRAYFDWRYRDRPCALPAEVVWAEAGGRPVGALSVFAHDYYILDGEYPLGVLGDISVDPEFRGRGIAGAMFRFLSGIDLQRHLGGGIVLPNEEAARPLIKNGWVEADRLNRHVRILDVRPYIEQRIRHKGLASALSWPFNAVIRWTPYELLIGWRQRAGLQSAVITAVDDRFDDLWRRFAKRGHVLGVRSAAYLRWRYQNHPVNRYEIFTLARAGDLCGYLCYRMSDGTCLIDDIFAQSGGVAVVELLGAFLRHIREQHIAASVTVNINNSYLNIPWRWFGFSRRADYQHVLVAPGGAGSGDVLTGRARTVAWHVAAGDKDV